VIQAQRDLAQAKTNELSALLAYDLSLVDFDTPQQAGPAGAPGSGASTSQSVSTPTATATTVSVSTGLDASVEALSGACGVSRRTHRPELSALISARRRRALRCDAR
jgi:hypothetical protein